MKTVVEESAIETAGGGKILEEVSNLCGLVMDPCICLVLAIEFGAECAVCRIIYPGSAQSSLPIR